MHFMIAVMNRAPYELVRDRYEINDQLQSAFNYDQYKRFMI